MADCHQARERLMRTYNPRKDILNTLSDSELVKRYRLDQAGVLYVTDLVREVLRRPTSRSHALTPEMIVLLTLPCLAMSSPRGQWVPLQTVPVDTIPSATDRGAESLQ